MEIKDEEKRGRDESRRGGKAADPWSLRRARDHDQSAFDPLRDHAIDLEQYRQRAEQQRDGRHRSKDLQRIESFDHRVLRPRSVPVSGTGNRINTFQSKEKQEGIFYARPPVGGASSA